MSILYTNNIEELKNFAEKKNQLTILNRKAPSNAIYFFDKLIKLNFTIIGEVYKSSALSDVRYILDQQFTKVITNDPFYDFWLEDISLLCKLFCDIEKSNYISLWLGSKRGCQRYHIDDVPQRLLVTYAGQGTEWIPDEAADRNAYYNGEPNENIIKDKSATKYIDKWDVAIFRGGSNGLLHKTPKTALKTSSVLMRLDYSKYWDRIFKRIN